MNNSNQRLSAGVIAAAVLLLVAACGEPKSPQQVVEKTLSLGILGVFVGRT